MTTQRANYIPGDALFNYSVVRHSAVKLEKQFIGYLCVLKRATFKPLFSLQIFRICLKKQLKMLMENCPMKIFKSCLALQPKSHRALRNLTQMEMRNTRYKN